MKPNRMLAAALCAMAIPLAQAAEVDPTRPLDFRAPAAQVDERLALRSILISRQRKLAVINDRVVAVGDRVAGATVINIEPGRVQLSIDGKRRDLTLTTPTVKRSAAAVTGDAAK